MLTLPSSIGDMPITVRGETDRPAVLVLHQAHGMTPQVLQWVERLADHGYLAIAPALHHRRGVGVIDPVSDFGGDLQAFTAALPTDDDFVADMNALRATLDDAGVRELHALGFSYGGRAAYLAASLGMVKSAVSWYPVGIQANMFAANDGLPALSADAVLPRVPWLGLAGEADPLLVPGELDELQAALDEVVEVKAELVRYPGATHGFDIRHAFGPDAPDSFHQEAFDDGLARTLSWFGAHSDGTDR